MILFASDFAEPQPVGSTRFVAAQAQELRRQGVDVQVLTWPRQGSWLGPRPDASGPQVAGAPALRVDREGVPYIVLSLPLIFGERFPTETEWETMVAFGEKLLRELKPDALHVFFWQGHWWLLEAAYRAGVPAIYTACDFGILCHRTILVTSEGAPCEGPTSIATCTSCVVRGRNAIGRLNELVAAIPPARPFLSLAYGSGDGPLARRGGVRLSARQRVGFLAERAHKALSRLSALITMSPFAGELFARAGAPRERIHMLPGFSGRLAPPSPLPVRQDDTFRLGLATRISPEKGLHVLLEAVALARPRRKLSLHIAGDMASAYASSLQTRFAKSAGPHSVEWLGWLQGGAVDQFVEGLHAVAVPSQCADNTPNALVEALAAGRPVLCTDLPSLTHVARNEVNALGFPFGDAPALARVVERLVDEPGLLEKLARETGHMPTVESHCARLAALYAKVTA